MIKSKVLLTLKIGKRTFEITEKDKFVTSGSSVLLLGQGRTNPELNMKHLKEINKFERIEHAHEFGSMTSVFSLGDRK
ncbi:hypothetical protein MSP8886_01419 [Marinomonas spartinae]|uniref:Uncharacterized protein n=1 Tax=Marinomonas spartinae TaxID=1792290 RepID=A0A1A8TBR6_9GAMM|nr:hypothetical protein [Marinomonas spartinae]SBS29056.1 hypothetical protein MSP8886_01419 [Marinomonas spartinae]